MEIRLQSGKLIIVEDGRVGEIWKLKGFLTEKEMEELDEAAKRYRQARYASDF